MKARSTAAAFLIATAAAVAGQANPDTNTSTRGNDSERTELSAHLGGATALPDLLQRLRELSVELYYGLGESDEQRQREQTLEQEKYRIEAQVIGAVGGIGWTAADRDALQAALPSAESVAMLINALADEDRLDVRLDAVHEFRLIPIAPDGRLALFALIDVNGRGFLNEMDVVHASAGRLQLQTVGGQDYFRELAESVADLDGDGVVELLVPEALSEYRGASPRARHEQVWRWDGSQFIEASSAYRPYYEQVALPAILRQLQEVSASPTLNSPDNDTDRLSLEALELEKNRIEALLGQAP